MIDLHTNHIMKLSPQVFRDTDSKDIDLQKNKRFVIERILMKGGLQDVLWLIRHYGKDTIRQELLQSRYIDKRTLSFCAVIFNFNKEDCRCYKLNQSTTPLWDY